MLLEQSYYTSAAQTSNHSAKSLEKCLLNCNFLKVPSNIWWGSTSNRIDPMQKCQNGHKLTRAWSNLVFWLCCCTGVTRTLTCSIFTCWRNLGVWLRCHQNWFPGPIEQIDPLAGFWNNLASWEDFNFFPQLEQSKFKNHKNSFFIYTSTVAFVNLFQISYWLWEYTKK